MFSAKLNTKEWDDFVRSYKVNFSYFERQRILGEAASYVNLKILERTAKGIDIYEDEFIPYAPITTKIRREAGYPVWKVDLFFTGRMLNSLTHDTYHDEGRVYFLPWGNPSPTEKALKNNQTRPFFGVSEEDAKAVFKIVDKAIDRIFK